MSGADIISDLFASIMLDNSPFCKACLQFKITKGSFTSDPYTEHRMHQLGSYQDVYDRKSCSLCQLIAEAYYEGPLPYGPKSSASWSKDLRVQGCWEQASTSEPNASYLRIYLIQYHEERKAALRVRLEDNEQKYSHFGKEVTGPLIDFQVVKGWLEDCQEHHACHIKAVSAVQTPALFKVIDVQKMCVVEPPPGCRYLTLSYVWGTKLMFLLKEANLAELSSTGGLKANWEKLSPTIRDAIHFARKLGETYLWVDSLCIVQDSSDKLDAIQDMDLIYTQATAMICAADDRSPDHGLPGVNSPRKLQHHVREISPGFRVVAQHDFLVYVESSIYATRGWTYQEEQLATRIFHLVNDQIYLTCLENIYTEDVVGPIPTSTDVTLASRINAQKPVRDSSDAVCLRYFNAVKTYTSRNLTYSSDMLNAFAGVLSTQSKAFRTETHYGLPACFFDLALLWQPTVQITRRPGFPSWSWAGWSGAVRWLGDTMGLASYWPSRELELEKVTEWHVKHTWIMWRKYGEYDDENLIWNYSRKARCETGEDDIGYRANFSTSENPYGRTRDMDPNGPNFNSIRSPAPIKIDNSKLPLKEDAYLHFSAVSARYRIRPSTAYLKYGSLDPNWEPAGRVVFHILNQNMAISGYVLLDESWREIYSSSPETEYEFILLSDADYYCSWGRPHEGHPYKKSWEMEDYIEYHVMMIKWMKEGTAERVGLGRLHHEALKDAWGEGYVWKEIVLG